MEKSSLFRGDSTTKTKVVPSDEGALPELAVVDGGLSDDPSSSHRGGQSSRRRLAFISKTPAYTPLKRKTCVNRMAKTCKEKTRRLYQAVCILNAILSIFLYFLDVVTDLLLCVAFYRQNYMEWFFLMVIFIVLPYAIATIGIAYYAKLEHAGMCRLAIYIFSPVLPIICDMFLPFYSVTQHFCPDELINFMVQYEATRTLSEAVLETIPQLSLQVYIYLHCQGQNTYCEQMEETGNTALMQRADIALIQSLVAGGVCVVYRFVVVYLDMKHQGLTLKAYLKSLIQLGAGLPLRAITENSMRELKLPHAQLLNAQVRSLSTALKNNTSLTKIDLCDNQIGNAGAGYLAEALPKCLGLIELRLSSNNISDSGVRPLADAFSNCKKLETIYLGNNEIGDDGAMQLAQALSKSPACTSLRLYHNNIKESVAKLRHLKNRRGDRITVVL